ncbi:hypothetical protein D3C76_579070 [compost metagenome]
MALLRSAVEVLLLQNLPIVQNQKSVAARAFQKVVETAFLAFIAVVDLAQRLACG